MARVTVEDCLEHCRDRFYLVLSAADRAHRLEAGVVDAMVDEDNDKPTVVALREIAKGYEVDYDATEVTAREEEDRLAERFMSVKRGDDMSDAMSFINSGAPPVDNMMPDVHFSEHFGMTPDAATPLPDDLQLGPKRADKPAEPSSDESTNESTNESTDEKSGDES